jgi:hypothetical protein
MGLHANPLKEQKPNVYRADGLICQLMARLNRPEPVGIEDVEKIQEYLEVALSSILDVYEREELRRRIYERVARPLPKNKRNDTREK